MPLLDPLSLSGRFWGYQIHVTDFEILIVDTFSLGPTVAQVSTFQYQPVF